MKTSELIKKLREIMKVEGDLPVGIFTEEGFHHWNITSAAQVSNLTIAEKGSRMFPSGEKEEIAVIIS